MEESLKYNYNPVFFEFFCDILYQRIPDFDSRDFVFRIFNNEWPDLELNERIKHISTVLSHFLSKDHSQALEQLVGIASVLRKSHKGQCQHENILLADDIEGVGVAHLKESEKVH